MRLAFAKWRFKVTPLESPYEKNAAMKNKKPSSPKVNGAHATSGDGSHPGEAANFVRSMRTKLDRGGDSVYNCDTEFNENSSQK